MKSVKTMWSEVQVEFCDWDAMTQHWNFIYLIRETAEWKAISTMPILVQAEKTLVAATKGSEVWRKACLDRANAWGLVAQDLSVVADVLVEAGSDGVEEAVDLANMISAYASHLVGGLPRWVAIPNAKAAKSLPATMDYQCPSCGSERCQGAAGENCEAVMGKK